MISTSMREQMCTYRRCRVNRMQQRLQQPTTKKHLVELELMGHYEPTYDIGMDSAKLDLVAIAVTEAIAHYDENRKMQIIID